jgi:HAE1 family hydrophobic/amphiphilic exporter-1
MLTLIVIPVVYLLLDDIKDKASAAINRYRAYRRFNRTAQSRALNSK